MMNVLKFISGTAMVLSLVSIVASPSKASTCPQLTYATKALSEISAEVESNKIPPIAAIDKAYEHLTGLRLSVAERRELWLESNRLKQANAGAHEVLAALKKASDRLTNVAERKSCAS